MGDLENRILQAFRAMNDEGRQYVLKVAENEVQMSGARKRPLLTLIQGGPQATPIRKRRRDRASAP